MKRISIRFALLGGLALLLTLGACDSITELNDNPNAPGEVQIPFLLTNAQTDLAQNYYDDFTLGRFSAYYAQYWAPTTYVNEARYEYPIVRAGANAAQWNEYYYLLNDLEEIKRITRESPDRAAVYGDPADIAAIATIQQAWVWQTLTDIYGPVPLDSALAGRDVLRPGYASQETIYRSIVDSLGAAAEQLTGEPALASADLLFNGDTEMWRAFANGLKMRYAIRAAEAAEEASTWFQEAYDGTSFTDMEGYQNATLPFAESSPYYNPIYGNTIISGREDFGMSRTLLNPMNDTDDPRRGAYANLSQQGDDYQGLPYGVTSSQLPDFVNDFSLPSDRVARTATSPAILYLESEELFMIAEAAERGWISADASDNYEEAIRASLAYWDAEDEADDFISGVPYDNGNGWAPAPEGGEPVWTQTLGIQKWIALYMQGVQGWSEFRRLDFDGVFYLPPPSEEDGPTPGEALFGEPFPFRLPYPNDEASLNSASYTRAVSAFLNGNDTQGEPLWWDDDEFGEPAGVAGTDD